MSRLASARSLLCSCLILGAFVIPSRSIANGRDQQGENKPPASESTPVLVELFTSEGCSSCPPADALVQRMDTLQPIAGAQLIVLSEHVTYWDHDGWKDPNSSAALTTRQDSYEAALRLDSPFTPQLIIDGTHSVPVSNAQQLTDTLQNAAKAPKLSVHIGEITFDTGDPAVLHTHIETNANEDKHNADVFLVVALDHVESQVLRGENGGHRLVHIAVVQQLTKVGKLSKGKNFSQDVQLKLNPGTDPKNVRLIAFVQEPGPGKLLGAALRKPTT